MHHFPGSGITAFTVERVRVRWWLAFAFQAQAIVEDSKKQSQQNKVRGRGRGV